MAARNLTRTLDRVREILEHAREQDGQGHILSETARRKAYQRGINEALAEINANGPTATTGGRPPAQNAAAYPGQES